MARRKISLSARLCKLSHFRKKFILALSIILLGLACFGTPEGAARACEPLKLEVFFDQSTYTTADPIRISFKLTNVSKEPLWVNTRCFLNAPKASKRHREVTLVVTGPDGKTLPCKYDNATGFPRSDHFKQLAPGEEVVSDNSRYFKGYYDIQGTGTYKVVATYKSIYGEELGLDVFQGPAISEEAVFTIEERTP